MISPAILEILRCPETHQRLAAAEPALIDELNARIAEGGVSNRSGTRMISPIEAGLIRSDGKILYPVQNGIPVMLVDEGILLS